MLYKSIAPSDIGNLPMYRINMLIDEWLEDIERQKKERKRQEAEQKAAQKASQPKQPTFKQPKFPKMG